MKSLSFGRGFFIVLKERLALYLEMFLDIMA